MKRLFLLGCYVGLIVGGASCSAVVPYNDRSQSDVYRDAVMFERRVYDGTQALPQWPHHAKLYNSSSYMRVDLGMQLIKDAYSSNGTLEDSAAYWFKKNPVQIQDLILMARLIHDGKVIVSASPDVTTDITTNDSASSALVSTANHYLQFLSDFDLHFKARTQRQQITFRYARSCWEDRFYVGCEVPFVRASQKLEQTAEFDSDTTLALKTKTNGLNKAFPDLYSNGLDSLLNEILNTKILDRNLSDEVLGIGDIKFFINVPIKIEGADIATLSTYVRVPAPQHHNNVKVIQAFTGEPYGSIDVGVSFGLNWQHSPFINPHCYSYAQYSPNRLITRRVPRLMTHVVGGSVKLDGVFFNTNDNMRYLINAIVSEPDSTIPEFSDTVRSVNIRRGPEFGFQIGNVFNELWIRGLQFDVSYKFMFKANDVLGPNNYDFEYDRDVVTNNTYRIAHTASATLTYRMRDDFGFAAQCDYIFAGRRQMRVIDGSLGIFWMF